MKPDLNEGFEHEKPYHTPPEYPAYDVKIPPQHGVSDPLKVFISKTGAKYVIGKSKDTS